MRIPCALGMLLTVVGCASSDRSYSPRVDGKIDKGEWSAAKSYPIPSGGTIRLLRNADNLYIAISAVETGFPTIFVGDATTVDVLHASAAQASVRYRRSGNTWASVTPSFKYTLRQNPDGSQASEEETHQFLMKNGWLSTSDRDHGPDREFLVHLGSERRFLAVSILGIPSMKIYGWPANEPDDTHNLLLLQGEVPAELSFSPESWLPIGR